VTLTSPELAHVLIALGLLLMAAHGLGHAFVLLRQPRVIGEICGGLALGPTLLGGFYPGTQSALFSPDQATQSVLGAVYQLGLMLLMFASGAEMRSVFRRGDEKVVAFVTATGVLIPFIAGLLVFRLIDSSALMGEAGDETALLLVFSLAIAVTSIPVISRIMFDLKIIDTPFARIVLGVAVIEDVVVYVVLALALGMVASARGDDFGVPALLDLAPGSAASMEFHIAATFAFFILMLSLVTYAFRWSRRQRWNVVASSNAIAYLLLFIFAATVACVALGVTPLFGAFLAGVAASSVRGPEAVKARAVVKDFSFALFVPVYFAIVGLQLDLLNHFDPIFFIAFLMFACIAKSVSVFAGARLAGEGRNGATNLAIATNARGGPGIVLASASYAAGIISQEFYATLVMLAIITSLLAGSWLGRVVRSGRPLRERDSAEQSGRSVRATPGATPDDGQRAIG
jgi:Kef-type K+ transport system membrane component KefB